MRSFLIKRPWLLTVYLLAVCFAAFLTPMSVRVLVVASLIGLQIALLTAFRRLSWKAFAVVARLKFLFLFFVLLSGLIPPRGPVYEVDPESLEFYTEPTPDQRALVETELVDAIGNRMLAPEPTPRYWELKFPVIETVKVYPDGLLAGALLSAQIALVVLASFTTRTIGDKDSFIKGLRTFRMAPLLAYSLDATLAIIEGDVSKQKGEGKGKGDGKGGGRNPEAGEPNGGVLAFAREVMKGDPSPFFSRIDAMLDDAKKRVSEMGLDEKRAHDVAVIGGIGAVMMAFKVIKVMPTVPIFSGTKTVFFIPLYVLAAERTHSRWGATTAGTIMGLISFLNGDGRYGPFEILKHVTPGILLDLVWPIARKLPRSRLVYCGLGLAAAVARTSTEFAMIFALGKGVGDPEFLAFPVLKLIPNLFAGFLGGFLVHALLLKLDRQNEPGSNSDLSSSAEQESDC